MRQSNPDHLNHIAAAIVSVRAVRLTKGFRYIATLKEGSEYVVRANATKLYENCFVISSGRVTNQLLPWFFGKSAVSTLRNFSSVTLIGSFKIEEV